MLLLHEWLTLRCALRPFARRCSRRITRYSAVAGIVLAVVGLPGVGVAASAGPTKLSDAETIAYIRSQLNHDALRPRPTLTIQFAAPYLYVRWQQTPPGELAHVNGVIETARIDVRYANFDLWNQEGEGLNTIIVDCAQEYLCYTVDGRTRYYHGDIDYKLYTYTGRRIVQALNHLALAYSDKREKDPFQVMPSAATPDQAQTPEPIAPPAVPH